MSQENVEIIRRFVAAWNRGDLDAALAYFDPECEVVFQPNVPEPGPFHGHAELRQWVDGFRSAWDSHRAEVVQAEHADDRVLAILRLIGRGMGSSIETDDQQPHVFTLRRGLIIRWQSFSEAAEARRAAGLSE